MFKQSNDAHEVSGLHSELTVPGFADPVRLRDCGQPLGFARCRPCFLPRHGGEGRPVASFTAHLLYSGRRSGSAIDSSLEQEGAGCVKPRAPGGARVEMSRSEGADPHGPHVSARHLRRRHRLWWPTECDSVQSKCKNNRKYLECFAAASAGMSRFLRGMVWKRADAVA